MTPSLLWRTLRVPCRIVTTLLFDLKVYGVHNLPLQGGVLLVSNHQSYLDPVLLGVQARRSLSYIAKSELFRFRPFVWLIESLGAFPIRQGTGDVRAMKESIERLQEGHALAVFPEGSRSYDGKLLPIEPGIALMVRKAQVPVLPVVIDGAFRAWPKGSKIFRPAPIRVMYGHPMQLSGLGREQIVQIIDRALHNMLAELRSECTPARRQTEANTSCQAHRVPVAAKVAS